MDLSYNYLQKVQVCGFYVSSQTLENLKFAELAESLSLVLIEKLINWYLTFATFICPQLLRSWRGRLL